MNAAVSLSEVLARPDIWCANRLASPPVPAVSSGFPTLDAELPGGGWPRGTLTEILVDNTGFGECALLMPALGKLGEEERWSLLVAPPHELNAPAWAAWGIDLSRLAIASPTRPRDALWAAEHALSSGALGIVLCWTTYIDAAQIRRLQIAATGSHTLAFLFRPSRTRSESSAATLRLELSAGAQGTLRVNLLKRRGPPCRRTLDLEVQRPLKLHENDEFTVARTPSTLPFARSQRALTFA